MSILNGTILHISIITLTPATLQLWHTIFLVILYETTHTKKQKRTFHKPSGDCQPNHFYPYLHVSLFRERFKDKRKHHE